MSIYKPLGRCAYGLASILILAASDSFAVANATDRSISVGAGLGLADQGESPFVHGRELRVFARVRPPQMNLQPRVEFLWQHFDLDAALLTQTAAEPQVIGGDQHLYAGLTGLQWTFGRPRRVRVYVVGEVGYSWLGGSILQSDGNGYSDTVGAWMTSGGGGLELRLGPHGAFMEARYSHRYEDADAFFPADPWSISGGFIF
jgi:hypothetical protein